VQLSNASSTEGEPLKDAVALREGSVGGK